MTASRAPMTNATSGLAVTSGGTQACVTWSRESCGDAHGRQRHLLRGRPCLVIAPVHHDDYCGGQYQPRQQRTGRPVAPGGAAGAELHDLVVAILAGSTARRRRHNSTLPPAGAAPPAIAHGRVGPPALVSVCLEA